MAKVQDRIKALQQQRAAALAPAAAPASEEAAPPVDEVATIQAHFGGTLDQIVQGRQIQRIPISQIAPDSRPDMRQVRFLPHPHELMPAGKPAPAYADLIDELRALGQSLQERQIQPIVIYPGTTAEYPMARYLILVGQRRWTAAYLVGMEALDVVIVDPPTIDERVRIQYAENEDRQEFSDMERTWSLLQMKQALDDAPWETVESRLQISTSRRQQLVRLLAFTPTQQQTLARLRLQETQVRPLHAALRSQDLTSEQADRVLQRVQELAWERTLAADQRAELPKRHGVDGPTIARLVARTQRETLAISPTPRWMPLLEDQFLRTRQALQRAHGRIPVISSADRERLSDAISLLQADLDRVRAALHEQPPALEDE